MKTNSSYRDNIMGMAVHIAIEDDRVEFDITGGNPRKAHQLMSIFKNTFEHTAPLDFHLKTTPADFTQEMSAYPRHESTALPDVDGLFLTATIQADRMARDIISDQTLAIALRESEANRSRRK